MTVGRSPSFRLAATIAATLFFSSEIAFGESERVLLRYEVEPGCPDRRAFVERVRSHTGRVELTEEPAARVLEVSAAAAEGSFTGELRFGDAGAGGVARRVSGPECEEVVAALVLIAVVAVDPEARLAPLEPAEEPAREPAVAPPPPPMPVPSVEPGRVRPTRGPNGARSPASAHWRDYSARQAVGFDLRTPEAPQPSLAAVVATRVTREGAWRPALGLAMGYGQSPRVEAGAGEARYALLFARFEAWPHTIRFGSFEVSAALGFELGQLEGRAVSSDRSLVPAGPQTTPWYALTQVLVLAYRVVAGLHLELRAGLVEPLRLDHFYVDPPYEVVNRVRYAGVLAGLGVAYRFE